MTKVSTYIKAHSGFSEGDLLKCRSPRSVRIVKGPLTLREKEILLHEDFGKLYSFTTLYSSINNKTEKSVIHAGEVVVFLSFDLVNRDMTNELEGFVLSTLHVETSRKALFFFRSYETLIEVFRKIT